MTSNFLEYLDKHFTLENFSEYSKNIRQIRNKVVLQNKLENIANDFESYRNTVLKQIKLKRFVFQPFIEKQIRRSNKTRTLCLLSPEDKFIDKTLSKYLNLLSTTKSNFSIYKITSLIKNYLNLGAGYFLRVDIKAYFDNINHKTLIDIVRIKKDDVLTNLLESFLKTDRLKNESSTKKANSGKISNKGIPHGSAVSQALSNLYLEKIDVYLNKYSTQNGDLFFRYVDDICYLSKNEKTIENILSYLNTELESIGLKINLKKLKFGEVLSGFDYLGFRHSKNKISLSKKSLDLIMSNYYNYYKKYLKNSSDFLKNNSNSSFKLWRNLSLAINSSIRGYSSKWVNTNSNVDNSIETKTIDIDAIFKSKEIKTDTEKTKRSNKGINLSDLTFELSESFWGNDVDDDKSLFDLLAKIDDKKVHEDNEENSINPTDELNLNSDKLLVGSLVPTEALDLATDLKKDIQKNVYGLGRHLSIITDASQIKLLEKWLGNINKFFCYKISKNNKLPKTFIEIESILNWYYRYRNNHQSAINLSYSRFFESTSMIPAFTDSEMIEYLEYKKQQKEKTEKESALDEFRDEEVDENEYVYIRDEKMVAISGAGVYYDERIENWEPIPDDLSYS